MEEGKKEHMLPDGSADGDSVVIQGAFPELSKLPAGPGGSQYPEAFEQFWQAFPKHKNDTKGRAYRSWRAAQRKPGVTTGVLMAGAKRHAASMTDRPIDKRPYVQTWANGNGWEDQGDNAVDSGGDEPMDQWMARYRAENRTDL